MPNPTPKANKVLTRPVKRDVRVPASEQELLTRGRLAAELSQKRSRLEEEKKSAADEFKESIKAAEVQLNETLDEIRSGKITVRSADCVEEWDPSTGKYRLRWGDRVVEEREMNVEERKNFTEGIFEQKPDKQKAAAGEKPEDDVIDAEWERGDFEAEVRAVVAQEKNRKLKKDHLT
jgi:hypothetical protein